MNDQHTRAPSISVMKASAILIGIVVGIGIFKAPPLVAANVDSGSGFLLLWLAGGLLTIVGALCYAELGSRHPHEGGEYRYLTLAYGNGVGFLFAWGRLTVMQSGAIAAVAFAYGDYATILLPLGQFSPAIHGALSIVILSAIQLAGTGISGRLQLSLTIMTVALIAMVAIISLVAEPSPAAAAASANSGGAIGLAMVFILLTYGGWSEGAYLSGEVRDARRNMVRVLIIGTSVVVLLYLVFNASLLYALGLEGLRQEKLVTRPVEQVLGPAGVMIVASIICVAAISTLNGTIFTGARSIMALGQEFPPLATVGRRDGINGAPANAIVLQAVIALGLIAFGAAARDGFTAMVEYAAPVFWSFMFLVGATLFIFRWRDPHSASAFRVPLYPLTPILFCATALYLLHASIAYTGYGSVVGLAILATGIPVYFIGRRRQVVSPVAGE